MGGWRGEGKAKAGGNGGVGVEGGFQHPLDGNAVGCKRS